CDNTVVALKSLKKGTSLNDNGHTIELVEDVESGHKIAVKNINKDENIIKYGYPIGHAKQDIKSGEWVHTHNTKTNLKGAIDYSYNPKFTEIKIADDQKIFMGYRRKNGDVGIRN